MISGANIRPNSTSGLNNTSLISSLYFLAFAVLFQRCTSRVTSKTANSDSRSTINDIRPSHVGSSSRLDGQSRTNLPAPPSSRMQDTDMTPSTTSLDFGTGISYRALVGLSPVDVKCGTNADQFVGSPRATQPQSPYSQSAR